MREWQVEFSPDHGYRAITYSTSSPDEILSGVAHFLLDEDAAKILAAALCEILYDRETGTFLPPFPFLCPDHSPLSWWIYTSTTKGCTC